MLVSVLSESCSRGLLDAPRTCVRAEVNTGEHVKSGNGKLNCFPESDLMSLREKKTAASHYQ